MRLKEKILKILGIPTYFDKRIPEFKHRDAWDTMRNMIYRLELLEQTISGLRSSILANTKRIDTLLRLSEAIEGIHLDLIVLENAVDQLRDKSQPQIIDTIPKRKKKPKQRKR